MITVKDLEGYYKVRIKTHANFTLSVVTIIENGGHRHEFKIAEENGRLIWRGDGLSAAVREFNRLTEADHA